MIYAVSSCLMLEKVLSVTYDSTDFVSAQQRKPITENQTLSYRLSRAPLSLAKCAIISKASRSKQLSASETKFLNRWRKSVLNEDPSVFVLSKRFDMALRDLSDSDKATLSKLGFNITATFDNMSVRDLIFELSETFNQSLIPEFEKQFAAESMYSTWHVNPEHVHRAELYVSNKRKLLLDRMEDFQWYNAGKFKQEDIDNIVEMFSIGRNKHARDAVYWHTDKQSLLDFIGEINDHDNRWELLGDCRQCLI